MIPARLDSTRLPGKLMMDLNGNPVILSTLLNTVKTNLFDDVYVVTDSEEIYNFLIKHHENILFSKENHDSGLIKSKMDAAMFEEYSEAVSELKEFVQVKPRKKKKEATVQPNGI